MKYYTNGSALKRVLAYAVRALPTHAANPTLDHILIEATAEGVRYTASDGVLTIVAADNATVDEAGRALLPGKLFFDTISSMPDNITISADATNRFHIVSGNARMALSGLNTEEYPARPSVQIDGGKVITVSQGTLKNMLAKTLPICSKSDLREVLTGCFIEMKHGNITITTCDGYRLSSISRALSAVPDKDFCAIVPGRAASEIMRLLSAGNDALCELEFCENYLRVTLGAIELTAQLIAGEYIDWRRIVPSEFTTHAFVANTAFRAACARATLVPASWQNNIITFHITDGVLEVQRASEASEFYEKLDVEQSGPDLTIGFNIHYINNMAQTLADGNILMRFSSSTSPAIFCAANPDTDEADYFQLVLPVRLTAEHTPAN